MKAIRCSFVRYLLVVLFSIVTSVGAAAAAEVIPPQVTLEEQAMARQLAEQALLETGVGLSGKTYFISAEKFRDKVEEDAKKVQVTHYVYDSRTSYLTIVDLAGRVVETQHAQLHGVTDISLDEMAIAEAMARALPEVAAVQKHYAEQLRVMPYQLEGWSYGDEDFSERVLMFGFHSPSREGLRYLEEIGRVIVDLRREQAWLEPPLETAMMHAALPASDAKKDRRKALASQPAPAQKNKTVETLEELNHEH